MRKGITNILNICRVNILDTTYQHTVDFSGKTSQKNYFNSKRVYQVQGNYIIDSVRAMYVINKNIEDIGNIDYLYVNDTTGKTYYYFITGIEYNTASTTIIYVELDVFQTYLFDMELLNSFVDRCHSPRWDSTGRPVLNVVPEDLQRGDFTILNKTEIYNYKNDGGYIITSTEPLGVLEGGRRAENIKYTGIGGKDTDTPVHGGDWKKGIISSSCFRFVKGYEGFSPYEYRDSAGNLTIAYGVTKHGEQYYYNILKSQQPVKEDVGARISYVLKNQNYGKKILKRCIELGVQTQQQFDALTDLAYNCGVGVILNDNILTTALKKNINDEKTIRPIWESFYTSDGVNTLQGLKDRRKAECNIFFNNVYQYRDIPLLDKNGNICGIVTDNDGNGWLPIDTESKGEYTGETIKNQYGFGAIPTHGTVTAGYPYYPSGSRHTGVDIANKEGTPIYSWRDGVVYSVGAGYGLSIVIDNDDKKSRCIYGHCSKVLVKTGEHVKEGQQIGLMGSTGNSTGNHLHFEVRPYKGNYASDVNPWEGIKVGQNV